MSGDAVDAFVVEEKDMYDWTSFWKKSINLSHLAMKRANYNRYWSMFSKTIIFIIYNPGQISWDTNTPTRQIEASSLPPSPSVQC